MSHLAFFNPPSTGHLYPAVALARRLAKRGHQITFFNYRSSRAIIRRAGLNLYAFRIDDGEVPPQAGAATGLATTLRGLAFGAKTVFAEAGQAIRRLNVDALVIDQLDPAAGTVAESLGLPAVTLGILPPVWIDDSVPPIGFGWSCRRGLPYRIRNRAGQYLFRRWFAPVFAMVNEQRRVWRLPAFRHINDIFSRRAIITQLPESFDFPFAKKPPHLFYTGPFIDPYVRRATTFPWERLNEKPLVYASLGTIRNDRLRPFRIIAEACAGLGVQLVVSLGGNPQSSWRFPGDPIVVQYAPQLEFIRRASLVITHAGINTTLESLNEGVPLVAIPISDDQPGVAARIRQAGAGAVVPVQRLSAAGLRTTIRRVLEDPGYHAAALRLHREWRNINGPELAADIVEKALSGKTGAASSGIGCVKWCRRLT